MNRRPPEPGDTFTVYLDWRDLERGYMDDPSACPVAQALIDSGKVEQPRVGTVVRDLPRDVCLKVVEPEGLVEQIDGGEDVEPGYVKVEVVEGYDTYEDAKAAHGGAETVSRDDPALVVTDRTDRLPVILRRFPNGEKLAVFPTLPGTPKPGTVTTYLVIGQHGHGDYGTILDRTEPADPEDCTDLLADLAAVGYRGLELRERETRELRERRRKNLEAIA